ncbi:hypothetical protein SAJA_02560 [Salinisphaera japonica YTM-1]|uniref:Uncharacterized protein n=1 Tax=Salinisphaera japonica YTM-1 TaxID=1209778 RepID=A0A423Q0R2_9GAMM|nr:hypothetical protein SAJA_02560 [Salinisphaera japonica YTM-1]
MSTKATQPTAQGAWQKISPLQWLSAMTAVSVTGTTEAWAVF